MIASPRLSPPWMLPLPYVSSLSLLELCEQVQRSSGEASGRDGTLSWERAAGCRYHIQGCSELTRIASLPPRAPAHPDPPPMGGLPACQDSRSRTQGSCSTVLSVL